MCCRAAGRGGSGVSLKRNVADSRKLARDGRRGLSAVNERRDAKMTMKMPLRKEDSRSGGDFPHKRGLYNFGCL